MVDLRISNSVALEYVNDSVTVITVVCAAPYTKPVFASNLTLERWVLGNFVAGRRLVWDQGVVSFVYVFFITLCVECSSLSAIPQSPTLHQET